MKVLLIDNYDSFTYNIVELLRQLNVASISIVKNDDITSFEACEFDKIILSPGPATPKESGNILEIIKSLAPSHSMLGICLGHQAIAEAFGATLRNEAIPYHGFRTELKIVKPHILFSNPSGLRRIQISNQTSDIEHRTSIQVGLYHSWTVSENNFPDCLDITSYSKENNIMSIKHKQFDVHGVQFHPESYMTEFGKKIIENFLFQ